jgi:hypothetical protein
MSSTEIDRGLEVSGADDGGAFYLFPEGDWLQVRCQVFDEADLDQARDLDALFETIARAQFRLIGCRFGFDVLTGLWLVADLYPGFEPERCPPCWSSWPSSGARWARCWTRP